MAKIKFPRNGIKIELSADAKTVHILTEHDLDVVIMGPDYHARVMHYVAGGSDSPPPTNDSMVPATPLEGSEDIPDAQDANDWAEFCSTYHHRTGVLLNTDRVGSDYSGSFDSQSGEPTGLRGRRW